MNTSKAPDPFQMLYRARWNIPKAAEALGYTACEQSWEWVKTAFRDWCLSNGPDYKDG
jgi:hypothetical protein